MEVAGSRSGKRTVTTASGNNRGHNGTKANKIEIQRSNLSTSPIQRYEAAWEEQYADEDNINDPFVSLLTRASDTISKERDRGDLLTLQNAQLKAHLINIARAYQHDSEEQGASVLAGLALHKYVRDTLLELLPPPPPPPTGSSLQKCDSHFHHNGSANNANAPKQAVGSSSCGGDHAAMTGTTHADVSAQHECNAQVLKEKGRSGFVKSRVKGQEHESKSKEEQLRCASTHEEDVARMTRRLRRALAPQPTSAQLSLVIDAMVHALMADMRVKLPGVVLHFTQVAECTYRLRMGSAPGVPASAKCAYIQPAQGPVSTVDRDGGKYTRKRVMVKKQMDTEGPNCGALVKEVTVHLSIDDGRLCIVQGGGHVDLLEYLDRRLHL